MNYRLQNKSATVPESGTMIKKMTLCTKKEVILPDCLLPMFRLNFTIIKQLYFIGCKVKPLPCPSPARCGKKQ